ncbi:hypothetical protein [Shewanella sp. MBTL60-007]|uniref:hypothetical protein n=1 Tax=Shewanella sp. MBTL60-007 TaxID=2815911 RepID=UPI001BBB1D4E|nr:hypothetical protein [Shewanella sp. MBTL60-007]GIU31795.1 hypothetical protein TUM3792_43820 [Shewanella sp. MBTL60-007]
MKTNTTNTAHEIIMERTKRKAIMALRTKQQRAFEHLQELEQELNESESFSALFDEYIVEADSEDLGRINIDLITKKHQTVISISVLNEYALSNEMNAALTRMALI